MCHSVVDIAENGEALVLDGEEMTEQGKRAITEEMQKNRGESAEPLLALRNIFKFLLLFSVLFFQNIKLAINYYIIIHISVVHVDCD